MATNADFLLINGQSFPAPDMGLNLIKSTFVSSARNANGVVVGQIVGRVNNKIDNLVWLRLDAETWASILQQCEQFYMDITFPDMATGQMTTVRMYHGDITATPIEVDKSTGLPKAYMNCKVNFIDVGE